MENLSFQYPTWYLLLCILLGIILTALLYWKDSRFTEHSRWLTILLALLRFLAITGLATLLLSPLLKQISEEVKDPAIIILEDKSESVQAGMDDAAFQSYESSIENLTTAIQGKFEVINLAFGDDIRTDEDSIGYQDKVTNLSEALDFINDSYNDYNLGAIILSSDGIYNEGKNPLYQNLKFKAPVYSIALGDTTVKKDLAVKQVFHNKIAYLGDKFGIQVDIQAKNANGSRSKMRVQRRVNDAWQTLQDENISIASNDYFETKNIVLDANRAGVIRYRIVLNQIADESSTTNNIKDIYVEVLDAKQKILVLANSPNPDIASIKQLLETNKNYEIEIKYKGDDLNINDFDFVIFHNLPSNEFNLSPILDRINARKTPRMFIVGQQTALDRFNNAQDVVNIRGKAGNSNEVQAIFQKNFSLFNLDPKSSETINQFVPVIAPFGEYKEGPKTNTLLYQKIGKIETKYPLLSFSEENGIKTAVLAAEGLWKWKLFEYLQYQNFDIVNDILSKAITYTSVKEDKRKFRVSTSDNLFKENEKIVFDAQLYNNSYQLINDPEVFITVKNDGNEEFNYTFSKRDNGYLLDAGILPEGNYSYEAYVNYEGKKLSQNGSFSVQSIQLELYRLTANHNLLHSLSDQYGGQVYLPNNLDELENVILSNEGIKPIIYPTVSTKSIVHNKWIFIILFLFLGLEWFLRRYLGSY